MSYILDALRKSEQARQQNTATQQYSLLPGPDDQIVARRSWPYVLAAALLVNAAVFYFWLRPTPTSDRIAIKEPAVTQPPKALAEKKADSAPAIPLDTPAPVLALQAPKEFERQAKPVGVQPPELRPKASPAPTAATALATVEKPAVAVTAASPKEPGGLGELPSSLQKELPALTVSGVIREQGSNGMAIVNDKLVREGDEVAPGLKLEKIQEDSLVFSYKGYRFVR